MTRIFLRRSLSKSRSVGFLLILATIMLPGCGSNLLQVKGLVTVDGQPAEGVVLIFHPMGDDPAGLPATTVSGPGGSFSLSTNMEDGIRPGSYKVNATWPDPKHKGVAMGFSDPEPAPDVLNGQYSGQSSALNQEIDAAHQDLRIELTTQP